MEKTKKNGEANELALLQTRISELEIKNKELAEQNKAITGSSLEQIRIASKKNRKDASGIRYKEVIEYVPLKLYHVSGVNIGKVVGPMHPDNAEDTFMRFAGKGIKLSINPPTEAEIEKYKQTEEFKALDVKEKKRRDGRTRSRKESEVDRLTKAIGTMTGGRVVNAIKEQSQVK